MCVYLIFICLYIFNFIINKLILMNFKFSYKCLGRYAYLHYIVMNKYILFICDK